MARPWLRYGRYAGAALSGTIIVAALWVIWATPPSAIAGSGDTAVTASDNIDPADTLELTRLQEKFEAIARRVSPSVVAISAAASPADGDDAHRAEEMNPAKLQDLLDKTTRTVGTGFVIDADGYILTNEHVVGEAEELWITTDDHKVYPALVVGSDPRADLAVLKIPANHLTAIKFAQDNQYQRGQWSIALGNPYGLSTDGQMCMSVGVIAAIDRSLPKLASKENRLYSNLIQTTAEINPGNSGGPLFDIHGDVIGVNTAVILPQKQTNGIGFALPVNASLLAEIHDLEQGKEIVYAYLGVTVSDPTARQRKAAGVADDAGVHVDAIEADSPAAASDLIAGDLILQLDGQAVHDSDQFIRLVGSAKVGEISTLSVWHDGKVITAAIIPKRRPSEVAGVTRESQRLRWRGMLLGAIPANWLTTGKPQPGLLVVGIDADSPLKKDGIAQGSVITTVAGQAVTSVAQLMEIINDIPPERCEIGLAASSTNVAAAPAAQTVSRN